MSSSEFLTETERQHMQMAKICIGVTKFKATRSHIGAIFSAFSDVKL